MELVIRSATLGLNRSLRCDALSFPGVAVLLAAPLFARPALAQEVGAFLKGKATVADCDTFKTD